MAKRTKIYCIYSTHNTFYKQKSVGYHETDPLRYLTLKSKLTVLSMRTARTAWTSVLLSSRAASVPSRTQQVLPQTGDPSAPAGRCSSCLSLLWRANQQWDKPPLPPAEPKSSCPGAVGGTRAARKPQHEPETILETASGEAAQYSNRERTRRGEDGEIGQDANTRMMTARTQREGGRTVCSQGRAVAQRRRSRWMRRSQMKGSVLPDVGRVSEIWFQHKTQLPLTITNCSCCTCPLYLLFIYWGTVTLHLQELGRLLFFP